MLNKNSLFFKANDAYGGGSNNISPKPSEPIPSKKDEDKSNVEDGPDTKKKSDIGGNVVDKMPVIGSYSTKDPDKGVIANKKNEIEDKVVREAASEAAATATGGETKASPVVDQVIKNVAGKAFQYIKKNKGKLALVIITISFIPVFIFFSIITSPLQMAKLAIKYGYKLSIPMAKTVVKIALDKLPLVEDNTSPSLAINGTNTVGGLQEKINKIDWNKAKDPSPNSKSECNFSTKNVNGIGKIDKITDNNKPININNINPNCLIDGFETNIPLLNKAFISPEGKYVAYKNRTGRSGALSKTEIDGLDNRAIKNKVKEDNDKKVRVKPKTKSGWTDDCVEKMITDYNFSDYNQFKDIACDIDTNEDPKKVSRELFCSYVDNYLDDKKGLANRRASDAASVRLFTRTLNKGHAQKAKLSNISLQEIGIMSKSNSGFNVSEEYYLLQGEQDKGEPTKAEQISGSAIGLKAIDSSSVLDSKDEVDKAVNACASLSKADSRKGIFGSITNFFEGGTGAVTVDNFIKKLPEKLVIRVPEYKRGNKYIVNQDLINKISRQLSGTFITNEEDGKDKFNVIMQGSRSTFDQIITLRGGRYLNSDETKALAFENAQMELYKDSSKGLAYRTINTNNTRSLVSLALHRSFTRIDNIPRHSSGILLAMIKPSNIFEWSNKIAFNYIGGINSNALAISMPEGIDSFGFTSKELDFNINTVISSVESKESDSKYKDLYSKLLECSKMSRVEILDKIDDKDFECKEYHDKNSPNYKDVLEWRQYRLLESTVNDLISLGNNEDDYGAVDDSSQARSQQ